MDTTAWASLSVTVAPPTTGAPLSATACSLPPRGVLFTAKAPLARFGAAARSSSNVITSSAPSAAAELTTGGTVSRGSTAGKTSATSAALPAASLTVTVTSDTFASAVSGVPLMTPVPVSMTRPDGRPVAPYPAMSAPPPTGLIAVIASPTRSDDGAVYAGAAGATRSTPRETSTGAGGVNPLFDASTSTSTLVPVMYDAPAGTLTDHLALPFSSADVASSVAEPISTVTLTPTSAAVSPPIVNPDAFSAMFTVPSPAMRSTFSTSAPADTTGAVTSLVTLSAVSPSSVKPTRTRSVLPTSAPVSV